MRAVWAAQQAFGRVYKKRHLEVPGLWQRAVGSGRRARAGGDAAADADHGYRRNGRCRGDDRCLWVILADRGVAIAHLGLPKPGLFSLFQPGDAEAALRRTGAHQIKDERVVPKAKDAAFTAVKERFLVHLAGDTEVILTDVASGQERRRSIAPVCAVVRARSGSDSCVVSEIDTDDEGQRLLLALDDGSIWILNADNSTKVIVAPKCPKAIGGASADPASCVTS